MIEQPRFNILAKDRSTISAGAARVATALHPRNLLDQIAPFICALVLGSMARTLFGLIETPTKTVSAERLRQMSELVLPDLQTNALISALALPVIMLFAIRFIVDVTPPKIENAAVGFVRDIADILASLLWTLISVYPVILIGIAAWKYYA